MQINIHTIADIIRIYAMLFAMVGIMFVVFFVGRWLLKMATRLAWFLIGAIVTTLIFIGIWY